MTHSENLSLNSEAPLNPVRVENLAVAQAAAQEWLQDLSKDELLALVTNPEKFTQRVLQKARVSLSDADTKLVYEVTHPLFENLSRPGTDLEEVIEQFVSIMHKEGMPAPVRTAIALLMAALIAAFSALGEQKSAHAADASETPTATSTPILVPTETPTPVGTRAPEQVVLPTPTATPELNNNITSHPEIIESNNKLVFSDIQLQQEYQLLEKLVIDDISLEIGSIIQIESKINDVYLIKLTNSDGSTYAIADSQTLSSAAFKIHEGELEPVAVATPESTEPLYISVEVEVRETTTVLNMRSGPGTSFEVVGSIPAGEIVEIIEDFQNGWAQVRTIDEKIAFVSTQFLSNARTIQKSVLNPNHPDYLLQGDLPQNEAIGGAISDRELSDAASKFFSEEVEIDTSSAIPMAKIKDFVVGEYRDGAWQYLKDEVFISEDTLGWYPEAQLRINSSGQPELIQQIDNSQSVLARWNEEQRQWLVPNLNSLELSQYAIENDIHYIRVAQTEKEAVEFAEPIPIEYSFELYPPIVEGEGQRRRNMTIKGIVNGDFRAIHIPVQKMTENGSYVDTEWSIRVVALPVAMLDESGKWHTHQVLTAAEQLLVDSDGVIYWSNYFDDSNSDQLFASAGLPSGFKANEVYNQSFPTYPLSELQSRVAVGDSVIVYVYGATNAVADSNSASLASQEAMELEESINFVRNQIGDFQFQADIVPNDVQKAFAPALAVNGLDSFRLAEPFKIMNDSLLLDLEQSGQSPEIFGNVSVVHTLLPPQKK